MLLLCPLFGPFLKPYLWKILIPLPCFFFIPLESKKISENTIRNFFSANFSKIYTKKSLEIVYQTFSRWKRNFEGWNENFSLIISLTAKKEAQLCCKVNIVQIKFRMRKKFRAYILLVCSLPFQFYLLVS
jgi:hypothetical protein